jgi:hypothetical protein
LIPRAESEFDAEPRPLHSAAIPGTRDRPCGSMQAGERGVEFPVLPTCHSHDLASRVS